MIRGLSKNEDGEGKEVTLRGQKSKAEYRCWRQNAEPLLEEMTEVAAVLLSLHRTLLCVQSWYVKVLRQPPMLVQELCRPSSCSHWGRNTTNGTYMNNTLDETPFVP